MKDRVIAYSDRPRQNLYMVRHQGNRYYLREPDEPRTQGKRQILPIKDLTITPEIGRVNVPARLKSEPAPHTHLAKRVWEQLEHSV